MQQGFDDGAATVVSLSAFRSNMRYPIINEVEAYWEGLRDSRPLPRRSELDPRALEPALDRVFLLERVTPHVVRFRLAGQSLHHLMGMDVRGMPLSALFTADARADLSANIESLFQGPRMVRLTLTGEPGLARRKLDGEMLLLPLCDEDGAVNRALGCLATEGTPGRAPRRFRIAATQSRDPCGATGHPVERPAPAAATAPGFAEQATPFDNAGSAQNDRHPRGRPALRLVKSGD